MKLKYTITGLECPNCAAKLEKLMEPLTDGGTVHINFLTERLTAEVPDGTDSAHLLIEFRRVATEFQSDLTLTED